MRQSRPYRKVLQWLANCDTLAVLQNRIAPSRDADATALPLGDIVTDLTK